MIRRSAAPLIHDADGLGVATVVLSDGARTVTLVGMIHVANPAFYAARRAELKTLADSGAAIHYEGIRGTPNDYALLGVPEPVERSHPLTPALSVLGLTSQHDLRYPPGARNVDWSIADRARHLGLRSTRRRLSADTRTVRGLRDPVVVKAVAPLLWWGIRNVRILGVAAWVFTPRTSWNLVVRRNRHAHKAAMLTLADTPDVVLVWGAGHLPGLRLFRRSGFRLVICTHLTAIPKRRPSPSANTE